MYKRQVEGGIKAVWNFTPFRIRVPENIVVQNTSLYAHLAVLFNRLNFTEKMCIRDSNDIKDNMDLAEDFIKYCGQWALDNCADDVKFLNDMFDKGLIERLQGVLKESFVRLPYTCLLYTSRCV